MLNAGDPATAKAVQRLLRVVRTGEKPIALWVGAGASAWAGYPLWPDLANRFHSAYLRAAGTYDAEEAEALLANRQYPGFFSLCRTSDRELYFRLLAENLANPPSRSPVHARFCQLLEGHSPLSILTTNVDETLERCLPGVHLLQRSNLERAADLLRRRERFLCKLHGTISDAESVVFTREDYEALLADPAYLELLHLVFALSSVVFIGYSLSDEYVLTSLRRSQKTMRLFGTGPHFLLTDQNVGGSLPNVVHAIRYIAAPHQDHRSPLQVIDMIRAQSTVQVRVRAQEQSEAQETHEDAESESPPATHSSYYLADFYPPGKWTSSQSVVVTGPEGTALNVLVGQGFNDEEIQGASSTSYHDLAVGLLCFDQTCLPLSAITRVHDLIGSTRFWHLHQEDALRFIHLPSTPAIAFPGLESPAGGRIVMLTRGFKGEMRPWTAEEIIRSGLLAAPGKEREAEAQFESLKRATVTLTQGDELPMQGRAALLHPRLQTLIGLSDAILPTSLPRWLAFPSLRLLHVVQAADACRRLGIPALKIPFGGERLVTAVIGAGQAPHFASEVAGYMVLQRFTGDLSSALQAQPHLFDAILRFRSTTMGEKLRREVFAALDVSEGSELEAAVNGGLRHALPSAILDRARDELEQLMVPQGMPIRPRSPAVWADVSYADEAIRRWRRRARQILTTYCAERNLGPYDQCPCGSQEKIRFCCEAALREPP